MKTYRIPLALVSLCLAAVASASEETPVPNTAEDPVHNELRKLRDTLTEAIKEGDVEKQLECVSQDVVVTWQNGEVVRGRDKLKDFIQKHQGGASKVFQGYKLPPTPEELTIMYGPQADPHTGISYGKSVGLYKILGKDLELENHWSATLVKEGDRWVIAEYHVSNNVLDNPVSNAAKNWLYLVGGIALVVGLILGLTLKGLGGLFKGRPAAAAAGP